jgi:hypothetical protein
MGDPGKLPRTKVVLTVDTEPSVAGAFADPRHRPLLDEPVAGDVNGSSEALGFLIETLSRHGLAATFFVETVHTRYFGERAMGGYVEQLLRAGQDVQLHLHPNWLSFEHGKLKPGPPHTDNCREMSLERLAALIAEGANQIADWTGKPADAMRTGNFSTGPLVFGAMQQAGLRFSSNICVGVAPPPERELARTGGLHEFAGIRELPVTCFADVGPVGGGRLRPMQVTALTSRELMDLLDAAHTCGNSVVVIVTHPFEFLKKRDIRYTGLRPNLLIQRRFRRLCAFLAENSDRFEVLPIGAAADTLDPAQSWTELRGNPFRSVVRAAENVVNDYLG